MCIHQVAKELYRLECECDRALEALKECGAEFYSGTIAGASSILAIVGSSIEHTHGKSCARCSPGITVQ